MEHTLYDTVYLQSVAYQNLYKGDKTYACSVTYTDFYVTETGPHMQKHIYFLNFHDHEEKI